MWNNDTIHHPLTTHSSQYQDLNVSLIDFQFNAFYISGIYGWPLNTEDQQVNELPQLYYYI